MMDQDETETQNCHLPLTELEMAALAIAALRMGNTERVTEFLKGSFSSIQSEALKVVLFQLITMMDGTHDFWRLKLERARDGNHIDPKVAEWRQMLAGDLANRVFDARAEDGKPVSRNAADRFVGDQLLPLVQSKIFDHQAAPLHKPTSVAQKPAYDKRSEKAHQYVRKARQGLMKRK